MKDHVHSNHPPTKRPRWGRRLLVAAVTGAFAIGIYVVADSTKASYAGTTTLVVTEATAAPTDIPVGTTGTPKGTMGMRADSNGTLTPKTAAGTISDSTALAEVEHHTDAVETGQMAKMEGDHRVPDIGIYGEQVDDGGTTPKIGTDEQHGAATTGSGDHLGG